MMNLTNRKLYLREWFGKNYDELLRVLWYVKYILLKTGKGGGKTTLAARILILLMTLDPFMCSVVMRKIMKDHGETTFPAIEKAFAELQEQTGYDFTKEWVFHPAAQNPVIRNIKTNQKFKFASFDNPNSAAGSDLPNKHYYYGPTWFEEPMQTGELVKKLNFATQAREKRSWLQILNSIHRQNPPGRKIHRWVIYTFNDWSDGNHWIIDEHFKPFINEDIKTLDTKGKQIYFDPHFKNGQGIFSMVGSAGINKFLDSDFLKDVLEIRKNDFEFYKAIWLGTRATFNGNAYGSGNLKKIKREIDLSKVEHFLIGWDYSSTADKTVLVLNGVNYKTFEQQIIDAVAYDASKDKNAMPDDVKIKWMWSVIEKWAEKYDFIASKKYAVILGDSRDTVVGTFLVNHWKAAPQHIKGCFVKPDKAHKFNNSSNFVRIMATRYLMSSGKLSIAKHLDWLLDEFKQRTIEIDGVLKDRGDDGPQAYEYSWSKFIKKLVPTSYYNWITSENQVDAWERRNLNEANGTQSQNTMT